jgi:hypothetical protein
MKRRMQKNANNPTGRKAYIITGPTSGTGVLLDASIEEKASRLVATSTQRIRCVGVDAGPSMLIRPDTCIAWAGEENNIDGLVDALCRWFVLSNRALLHNKKVR